MKSLFKSIIVFCFFITGCAQDFSEQEKYNELDKSVLDVSFEYSLIIPVTIQGKEYPFLIDTGASITVIDKKLAEKLTSPLNVEQLAPNYKEELADITTVSSSLEQKSYELVKPLPFNIGSKRILDNDVWLSMDLSLFSELLGVELGGFIGIDTIRQLNWEIDNKTHQLRATEQAGMASAWQKCTGYSDSYNRSPAFWLDFVGNDLQFSLDTGAGRSYVSNNLIEFAQTQEGLLSQDLTSALSAELGQIRESSVYVLRDLVFDEMPFGELKATGVETSKFAIGMDFLSRFDRYAIYPTRMMFCYDVEQFSREDQASKRNLSVRTHNQKIEFFYNFKEQLEINGLQNGDVLLSLNNIYYQPHQIEIVRQILNQTPKGELTITVLRDKQEVTINL